METIYIRTSDFAGYNSETDKYYKLKTLHDHARDLGRDLGEDIRVIYDLTEPLYIRMPETGGTIKLTKYTDFNGSEIHIASTVRCKYIIHLCKSYFSTTSK